MNTPEYIKLCHFNWPPRKTRLSKLTSLYLCLTYNICKERRSRTKNNFMTSYFSARLQHEQHICVPLVLEGGQPVIGEGGRVDLDCWERLCDNNTVTSRHKMEMFPALLPLFEGNLQITGRFPPKASVTELGWYECHGVWLRSATLRQFV